MQCATQQKPYSSNTAWQTTKTGFFLLFSRFACADKRNNIALRFKKTYRLNKVPSNFNEHLNSERYQIADTW